MEGRCHAYRLPAAFFAVADLAGLRAAVARMLLAVAAVAGAGLADNFRMRPSTKLM